MNFKTKTGKLKTKTIFQLNKIKKEQNSETLNTENNQIDSANESIRSSIVKRIVSNDSKHKHNESDLSMSKKQKEVIPDYEGNAADLKILRSIIGPGKNSGFEPKSGNGVSKRQKKIERKKTLISTVSEKEKEDFIQKIEKANNNLIKMQEFSNQDENLNKELLSKQNKFLEFDIKQDIEYLITRDEKDENGKVKYNEFKDKLDQIKKFDVKSYVNILEKNYKDLKDEIQTIQETRKHEDRLNSFYESFYRERLRNRELYKYTSAKITVKDNMFLTRTSEFYPEV